MDDEEEDMSRPISQLWGSPFRDIKYEDRATQIAAGQAIAAAAVVVPTSQGLGDCAVAVGSLPCGSRRQPRVPFHGNAGLRSHFPAHFEPTEDQAERQIEEEEEEGRGEEDGRMVEGPEAQAGVSAEARIGRKLREIGDQIQQDHIERFMRRRGHDLPAWMRLTMALFGFLFPRAAPVPRLRAEPR